MIAVVSCEHFPDDERIYHRQIKSLINNGYRITYFTRSESEINLSDTRLTHINFPLTTTLRSFINKIVSFFSENNPPKIFHIHEPVLYQLVSLLKTRFDINVIYDVHEDFPSLIHTFSKRNNFIKWIRKNNWLRKEKQFLPWVDKIILASPNILNCGYHQKGFDPVILENFPALNLIPPVNFNFNRGNTIIYNGHLGPERGISELIYSISEVSKEIPDVFLSLFGSFRTKKYQIEILELINQLSLDQYIKWHGQVKHKTIWKYLGESAVGVIPFLDNPLTRLGTPTKLFEYMASGCRIVASDLQPMKQYNVKGVLLVKPGNIENLSQSLVKALHANTNESLRINYKKIIEEYNWETIEHRLIETYEKLMK